MKREFQRKENPIKNLTSQSRKKRRKQNVLEITAFSDRAAEFEKLNTQILGVSVDSQFSHLAWIQTDRKEGGVGKCFEKLLEFFCQGTA